MKTRLLVPVLTLFACLTAAVSPALAREGGGPGAPGNGAELQRNAKDSNARYLKAKAEVDRLAAEVARLENRLAGVDEQQAMLRSVATRGAVALYMHDLTVDWLEGFGDGGENIIDAGRRARLVGGVNQLAAAAVRNLNDSARQIDEDRRRLKDRRHEQEAALAQLNGERQQAAGKFSAFMAAERDVERAQRQQERAERDAQRKADAAVRAAQRTSRADLGGRGPVPGAPASFICPLAGPFKWGDGWGAGRGHKGEDMLAPRGTENVAVVAGTFETRFWGGGGLTLFLTGDDGNTYVYMHLLQIVGERNRHVEQGEVIGLTGASGNASAYHTHFEFHPGGGGAVNPYPLLLSHCPPMPRDH
ncbi:MAG TPA: peptidoglycan DD-metalloendopeptidase family protein [Acidimicrobiia bacterium]|nr:peptidoglycan DD-metalloendopeptidase family protein [Acidimicrobiia bacterium]